MTPPPTPADVRLTAPTQPAGSASTHVRRGPTIHSPTYTVVVPITGGIADPDAGLNVRRLLRTATALAADREGRVHLMGIATVDTEGAVETVRQYVRSGEPEVDRDTLPEVVTTRQAQLARVVAEADALGTNVPVTATVLTVTETTAGVLGAIDTDGETAVLLLRGTTLDHGSLLTQSTISSVLASADCDVFVETFGSDGGASPLYVPDADHHTVAPLAEIEAETVDSVLVAVSGGPHAALATEAARAIARAVDADVSVLHVVSPSASTQQREEAEDLLGFARYILGSELSVETELREATDRTAAILEAAQDHDMTVIGYPEEQSRLSGLVSASVPDSLSAHRELTVLVARDANQSMRSLYYRWKQGIDATERTDATEETDESRE